MKSTLYPVTEHSGKKEGVRSAASCLGRNLGDFFDVPGNGTGRVDLRSGNSQRFRHQFDPGKGREMISDGLDGPNR